MPPRFFLGMIQICPAAAREFQRLLQRQQGAQFLRLSIQTGGCLGRSYCLSFDSQLQSDDQLFHLDGVQLVVDAVSLTSLGTLVIDYSEDLMGGGFHFDNSKTSQVCGCGNSFTLSTFTEEPANSASSR